MKICPNCGCEMDDSALQCPFCECDMSDSTAEITESISESYDETETAPIAAADTAEVTGSSTNSNKKILITIIVVLSVIVIALGGVLAYVFMSKNDNNNNTAELAVTSTTTATSTAVTTSVTTSKTTVSISATTAKTTATSETKKEKKEEPKSDRNSEAKFTGGDMCGQYQGSDKSLTVYTAWVDLSDGNFILSTNTVYESTGSGYVGKGKLDPSGKWSGTITHFDFGISTSFYGTNIDYINVSAVSTEQVSLEFYPDDNTFILSFDNSPYPIYFNYVSNRFDEPLDARVNVDSGSLNVRSATSTESDIIDTLSDDTKVICVSVIRNWYLISYGDNKMGFVSSEFIDTKYKKCSDERNIWYEK